MIGNEKPKPGRVEDLAGPGSDNVEIGSDGDGVVDRGVDFFFTFSNFLITIHIKIFLFFLFFISHQ
jgi:hypothetical protein